MALETAIVWVKSAPDRPVFHVAMSHSRTACGLMNPTGPRTAATPDEREQCGSCRAVLSRRRDAKAGKPLRKDLR